MITQVLLLKQYEVFRVAFDRLVQRSYNHERCLAYFRGVQPSDNMPRQVLDRLDWMPILTLNKRNFYVPNRPK